MSALRAEVVRIALAQRGKPYVFGTAGPSVFDCSGLILYVYRLAGASNAIGGGHNAVTMYQWARAHGLTSSTNPLPGDLVVFGNGAHIGIYLGGGCVISALNAGVGVVITGVYETRPRFTTFIHTGI